MARLEIRPFSDEFVGAAGELLAARHRAHRAAEPLLPERYEEPAAAQAEVESLLASEEVSGSVALRDGRAVGYLLGAPRPNPIWGDHVWVELAGHAVEHPEDLRDLYAGAAAGWVEAGQVRHYALVPAHDLELLRAWARVGFGQQHAHGVREVPETAWPEGVRRAEERDVDVAGGADAAARRTISRSPPPSPAASLPRTPTSCGQRSSRTSASPRSATSSPSGTAAIVGAFQLVPAEMSSVHAGVARPDGAALLGWAATDPEVRGSGAGVALTERRLCLGARARSRDDGHRLARDQSALLALLARPRVPRDVPAAVPAHPIAVTRIPIPSGSRVAVVNARDGVVLRPPRPSAGVVDVAAAVRDALRFPLSGSPLEALVTRGGTATLVVQPPELPASRRSGGSSAVRARSRDRRARAARHSLTAPDDPGRGRAQPPRRATRAGVAARAVRRAAVPRPRPGPRRGIARPRPSGRRGPDAAARQPAAARDRHRPLRHRRGDRPPRRPRPPSSAPAGRTPCGRRRRTRCSRRPQRADGSWASRSSGRSRPACPLMGTSLVLNPTRLAGRFRGYPYEDASLDHLARSPLRRFSLAPSVIRRRVLQDLARELTAVAAFAGPPSVAHAEALLRGIARRSAPLERPLDALVVGMPWKHHHSPRERLNPITVAAVALGLALRLWRDAFPVADGGTAIVLHRLSRHFVHGTQDPVPHALPLAPRRPHGRASGAGRARSRCRRPSARRLSRRQGLPSAPALRRLGQLPAGARPARRRRRRGLPRPPGGAHAWLRAHARRLERTRDGARPGRRPGADRLSARSALLPARGRDG